MKNILVVDDNEDFLYIMKGYIKRMGHQVAVTTTCSHALALLAVFRPDLIVLDVNVGEEDGRQTCSAIKAMADYRHIPVILISANHEYGNSYREYGAELFVGKPLSMELLSTVIQPYLPGE